MIMSYNPSRPMSIPAPYPYANASPSPYRYGVAPGGFANPHSGHTSNYHPSTVYAGAPPHMNYGYSTLPREYNPSQPPTTNASYPPYYGYGGASYGLPVPEMKPVLPPISAMLRLNETTEPHYAPVTTRQVINGPTTPPRMSTPPMPTPLTPPFLSPMGVSGGNGINGSARSSSGSSCNSSPTEAPRNEEPQSSPTTTTISSTNPNTNTVSSTTTGSSSATGVVSGTTMMLSPRKRYPCFCGRTFSTSGHLTRHARIHTGEKNHSCPFENCEAKFSRHDNCMQHYRTHLTEAGAVRAKRRRTPKVVGGEKKMFKVSNGNIMDKKKK